MLSLIPEFTFTCNTTPEFSSLVYGMYFVNSVLISGVIVVPVVPSHESLFIISFDTFFSLASLFMYVAVKTVFVSFEKLSIDTSSAFKTFTGTSITTLEPPFILFNKILLFLTSTL